MTSYAENKNKQRVNGIRSCRKKDTNLSDRNEDSEIKGGTKTQAGQSARQAG